MKSRSRFLSVFTMPLVLLPAITFAESYFPPGEGNWETTSAESANLDPENIKGALEYAKSKSTSSLLIIHNGRIVSENYWQVSGEGGQPSPRYERMHRGDTAEGHPIEDVASVQKSIISFLAGTAIGEGGLSLDESVTTYLGVGWSKAAEAQEKTVLIRHLMSMTTGLGNKLQYQVPAGTRWRYNTVAYSHMVPVLEKVFDASINDITSARVAKPIGMANTSWMERPWARGSETANSVGLATTARDLGRFGILILSGGEWNGRPLLKKPDYLAESLSSSQIHNKAYGLLWWLNGKESSRSGAGDELRIGAMIPSAPDDMVGAYGALGRKVYIVPGMGLVVVRLGDGPGSAFNNAFWSLLLGKEH